MCNFVPKSINLVFLQQMAATEVLSAVASFPRDLTAKLRQVTHPLAATAATKRRATEEAV